jgi:hypothetical protein
VVVNLFGKIIFSDSSGRRVAGVIAPSRHFLINTQHPSYFHQPAIMDQADDLSFHSYSKMGSSSDGPNPLRPYYKPPSIGLPEPNPNQSGAPASPLLAPRRIGTNSSRDFRELFSDLDYGDYLPQGSPSVAEMAKSLVDRTIWNYSSTVLAQPFEVAKVILQCQNAGDITQSTGLQEDRGYFGREHEVC